MDDRRQSGKSKCRSRSLRRWAASLLLVAGSAVLALSLRAPGTAAEAPESRLMRFPDIYKDKIVFSYGGDLWLASSNGAEARRITTNPGLELFPKFSPDGKWIAFTAQYDGNFNVYVMPSEGGQPKQLTFVPDMASVPERMGPNNEVITWSPDSKRIVFLSRRNTMNVWFGRLFSVSIDGGLPEQLAINKGGLTSFSPDGAKIAYNRIFRNFRTWKRYRGGMQQTIWIYDFKANHIEEMPHVPGNDTFPMWHGNTIYFASDRGPEQRQNLYRYDLSDGKIRQLTHFKDYDLNWPSLGPDSIIFENAGYLYVFDLKTEQPRKLTLNLTGDNDQVRRRWAATAKYITDFDVSPNGNLAVFTARGDVYTAPAKEGSIRNLTRSPGSRERFSTWSPDGKWIAYVSDRTGEDELYVIPESGTGKEVQITSGHQGFFYPPVWSPDSKKLAYSDDSVRLFYVNIDEKKPVQIDQGQYADITEYCWSPDSKWAAYAKAGENLNPVLYLYSLADQKITPVTDAYTSSWHPAFDPAGQYLYFLSNRSYNEVLGVYDTEFSNPKATGIYLTTLRSDLPSPFAPKPTEAVTPAKPKPEEKTEAEFRIDLDGIGNRIVAVPIPPGNLERLAASKSDLLYVSTPTQGLSGPLPGEPPAVHIYDLKERKGAVLVSDATNFALSFDGAKVLYSAPKKPETGEEEVGPVERTFGIVDAKLPEKEPHKVGEGAIDLAGMKADLDPHEEWGQIFREAWRQERDFFFERAMNGVDWETERKRYEPLVPYAGTRYDLTYIIGQMIGELCNSHTYVGGGDSPDLKPVNVGMLGVDFQADTAHGLYRFAKIYPGENWDPTRRSPLTEPGVSVKEGDYLISVNGQPLGISQNPYQLFVDTVNTEVTLEVNSAPTAEGARRVVVKPIGSEFTLRELDWITANRKKVDALSGGKVGYVYLTDMEARGLNAFVKQFFPQIRKEGMIIDVRYNGGGFVDQLIFERLRRVLAGMESARHWHSDTIPDNVFHGSMAAIANAYTASDGDFFTYFFKKYKLGPVVGERTWGGVRGIRGYIPLIDGGYITRPEFSLYDLESQWVVENHGVDPDVVVDDRPDLVMEGKDPQLETAVALVMKEIQARPPEIPKRPPELPAYPAYPTK